MATHLYTLGLSTLESQYYMGHKMEGSSLKRSDFGDETFLHHIWKKLQKHPLNNAFVNEQVFNSNSLSVVDEHLVLAEIDECDGEAYLLRVRSREYADPIELEIEGAKKIDILENEFDGEIKEEINITKFLEYAYK